MTIRSLLYCSLVCYFLLYCKTKSNTESNAAIVAKLDFKNAELFVLDSSLLDLSPAELLDKGIFHEGFGFIDQNGRPITDHYTKYELNEDENRELRGFFGEIECHNIADTMTCVPVYRHAFVFYDSARQVVGQIQLCLECNQYLTIPRKNNFLCGSADKRTFTSLSNFIRDITRH